ncbi:hypothetical protein CRG98_018384 [Punica granatum]|uniref:Uncharacterized protein n=1 Tax=Punica granatum TaxID=22663 RepID=A0A2I0K0J5_PUNGR|nr:hypothetical protein CRG98_018384 [Punica granatum]
MAGFQESNGRAGRRNPASGRRGVRGVSRKIWLSGLVVGLGFKLDIVRPNGSRWAGLIFHMAYRVMDRETSLATCVAERVMHLSIEEHLPLQRDPISSCHMAAVGPAR